MAHIPNDRKTSIRNIYCFIVIKILSEKKQPMTVSEIYVEIAKRQLYKFNTSSPMTIIDHAIRRACVGVRLGDHAKEDVFGLVHDEKGFSKYYLLEWGEPKPLGETQSQTIEKLSPQNVEEQATQTEEELHIQTIEEQPIQNAKEPQVQETNPETVTGNDISVIICVLVSCMFMISQFSCSMLIMCLFFQNVWELMING